MIKDIIKDQKILSMKSDSFEFGKDDELINDLIDTANANKNNCLGLACIQIGVPKRLIVVRFKDNFYPFINPNIVWKSSKSYIATERCLSIEEPQKVKRYAKIKVSYTTLEGKKVLKEYSGLQAQIIQHECDHLYGILI